MTPAELVENLKWRYAVKRFNPEKIIPDDVWTALEQSFVLTPSSYGLQPWKLIVVTDKAVKQELRKASWNQPQVEECSHYMVLTGLKEVSEEYIQKHIHRIHELRDVSLESLDKYKNGMIGDLIKGARKAVIAEWAARQIYILLGQAMCSAAALKIDSCPLEGISPKAYDEILGLVNTDYTTLCALAFGYRSDEDKYSKAKKVRFSADDIIVRI